MELLHINTRYRIVMQKSIHANPLTFRAVLRSVTTNFDKL